MATAQAIYPPLDLSKIAGKTRKIVPGEDVLSDVVPYTSDVQDKMKSLKQRADMRKREHNGIKQNGDVIENENMEELSEYVYRQISEA